MKAARIPSAFYSWYSCLLVSVAWGLCSCGPVLMLVYGIHQPKYRSDKTVANYAQRLGLEEDIYRLSGFSENVRKQFKYIGNQVPDVLLFNANGQLTRFEVDSSCSLEPLVQLSLEEIEQLAVTGNSLADFLADAYTINSYLTFKQEENKPVYVIKFAEYAGLLNKDRVPAMLEILHQRTDVQYIVLNMDYAVK